MPSIFTSGLYTINMGAIAANGGLGTSLTKIGYTKEGSASFNIGQADSTRFKAEESDYPVFIKKSQGESMLKFTVMDPDADVMVRSFGGTSTLKTVAAWATATPYKVGDYVTQTAVYYRCVIDHTSAAGNTPPNAAYWEPLPAQPKTWSAPPVPPTIEQSLTVVSQQGFGFNIIRGSVSAALNHELSRTGLLGIDIEVLVLQPKLAGQAPIEYTGG